MYRDCNFDVHLRSCSVFSYPSRFNADHMLKRLIGQSVWYLNPRPTIRSMRVTTVIGGRPKPYKRQRALLILLASSETRVPIRAQITFNTEESVGSHRSRSIAPLQRVAC
jgi:hypothetical protein